MKRLIVDLDGTLCLGSGDYSSAIPCISTVQRLKHYKSLGFQIVLFTSRNMRTYGGNIGLINKHTLPIIIAWLDKYNIEFTYNIGAPQGVRGRSSDNTECRRVLNWEPTTKFKDGIKETFKWIASELSL